MKQRGVSVEGRLLISDRAHMLFDLHKEIDGAREAELAGVGKQVGRRAAGRQAGTRPAGRSAARGRARAGEPPSCCWPATCRLAYRLACAAACPPGHGCRSRLPADRHHQARHRPGLQLQGNPQRRAGGRPQAARGVCRCVDAHAAVLCRTSRSCWLLDRAFRVPEPTRLSRCFQPTRRETSTSPPPHPPRPSFVLPAPSSLPPPHPPSPCSLLPRLQTSCASWRRMVTSGLRALSMMWRATSRHTRRWPPRWRPSSQTPSTRSTSGETGCAAQLCCGWLPASAWGGCLPWVGGREGRTRLGWDAGWALAGCPMVLAAKRPPPLLP